MSGNPKNSSVKTDWMCAAQNRMCLILIASFACSLAGGCGSSEPKPAPVARKQASTTTSQRSRPPRKRPPARDVTERQAEQNLEAAPLPDGPRSLADLLTDEEVDGVTPTTGYAPSDASQPIRLPADVIPIDDAQVAVAGIRKLQGNHLTLYTDVPPGPKVDDLPAIFDLAVPQWCAYFGVDAAKAADWRVTGFLMQDKTLFQATGLMPSDLPPFPNGFQRGPYLWVYDQSTAYYSRHLVLHEGTHAFMDQILGGFGPPWYSEGMAELLGTHLWSNNQLRLGYMPTDKTETPGWGRIKIIKEELAAGRGMMPKTIMEYGPQAHQQVNPYGWCWGLAAFLDQHPDSQQVFRQLRQRLIKGDASTWLRQQLQDDWSSLAEDWQVFVMGIEYGYDIARAAIVRKPAVPLPPGGAAATITVDRGWQSTGLRLEPGVTYQLVAEGRYQIAETSEVWWCEPGGVTIRYYQGRPLGMLLGAVRDDDQPLAGLSPLVRPESFGVRRTWAPEQGGTLYLKVNESAADLADNRGEINVRVHLAN